MPRQRLVVDAQSLGDAGAEPEHERVRTSSMSRCTIVRPSTLLRSTDRLSLPSITFADPASPPNAMAHRVAGGVLELDHARAERRRQRDAERHRVEVTELDDRSRPTARAPGSPVTVRPFGGSEFAG